MNTDQILIAGSLINAVACCIFARSFNNNHYYVTAVLWLIAFVICVVVK